MSLEQIRFNAPEPVRAALRRIGRTEDVAVSPDGSRLALAAFSRNSIEVFSLAIRRSGASITIAVAEHVTVLCDRFSQPHGCTFLDVEHLLVANRGGDVVLVRVPQPSVSVRTVRVEPCSVISGRRYLGAAVKTPGSVTAYADGPDRFRAFVCSDQWHFVTSHLITLGRSPTIVNEGIRLENRLQIPDGISLSPDLQWIAISNHVRGEILLFRNSPELNRRSMPQATLGGMVCPHGLSFDADGHLYVADAASPYVHRYDKRSDGWRDQSLPSKSYRILQNETFYSGRYAAREGGVKGIHVDQGTGVLITTHNLGTLEFYDLHAPERQIARFSVQEREMLMRSRDEEIAASKSDVLQRRWNLPTRISKEIDSVADLAMANIRAVLPRINRMRLELINRNSRSSILDPAGPVLSMTSHSTRIAWAHLAIESIAQGVVRPKRVLLWLSDKEARGELPDSLSRLESRGLEICYTRDLGPHTKYFPYVASESYSAEPLVTADDDIVYPKYWLAALIDAQCRAPEVIHCHRARRMRLNQYHFEPYNSWRPATDVEPHPLNFSIGASGVIYPKRFLDHLRARGAAFESCCPTADDIWLNWVAHREGFRVAQVSPMWPYFAHIPASQTVSLYEVNGEGGNQQQLARTYSDKDRAELRQ